ncbi:MAG: SDR family oxidoreductase [Methylobacteriaceae bacterium]|nr:SDR family oxidoreductase [Methylobacteriaceae bacterium]
MNAKTGPHVAIVTGAARRIGAAIAQRLARDAFSVVLHAREAGSKEARAEADRISAQGGKAVVVTCDLTEQGATGILFAETERAFGPVTLLVNNASVFEPDSAADFSPELFDRHMAVNVRAPLLLAQEMRRRLPANSEGAIVNIVDQRVLRPTPLYFTYSISKSALWYATLTMAQAFAPDIRVNAVGPGPILPNAHDGAHAFAEEAAALPLKRAASVEDICDAVTYFANARGVTGQFIAIDGGQHLAWETPDILALNRRSADAGS